MKKKKWTLEKRFEIFVIFWAHSEALGAASLSVDGTDDAGSTAEAEAACESAADVEGAAEAATGAASVGSLTGWAFCNLGAVLRMAFCGTSLCCAAAGQTDLKKTRRKKRAVTTVSEAGFSFRFIELSVEVNEEMVLVLLLVVLALVLLLLMQSNLARSRNGEWSGFCFCRH